MFFRVNDFNPGDFSSGYRISQDGRSGRAKCTVNRIATARLQKGVWSCHNSSINGLYSHYYDLRLRTCLKGAVMASVSQLGYIGIGVSDVEAWHDLATHVLGMQVIPGDKKIHVLPADGRISPPSRTATERQ